MSDARSDRPVTVLACPDGPLLLRGATEVIAEDGTVHPVERPTVALCRCGRSARLPWCDSTHKLGPAKRQKR